MQRYSGYIITGLPIGLGAILMLISPTYMGPMFDRPPEAFGLPLGLVFALVGLLSMALGYFFISRIVDIKV
jgi:tight adherence protein B